MDWMKDTNPIEKCGPRGPGAGPGARVGGVDLPTTGGAAIHGSVGRAYHVIER